jgi:hypothetical protein
MPSLLVRVLALLALTGAAASPSAAQQQLPKDFKDLKLDLEKYKITPVEPKKDPRTGFVVGGTNATALIKTLKEINGRTIAQLEKDMRPEARSEVGSRAGFLGKDEKLLDVLAMDNKYVVDEQGLAHRELARHLHLLGAIGFWQKANKQEGAEFVYHGRRFKVTVQSAKGFQPSPFYDDTRSNSNATVVNVATGKRLTYGLLVPYMVERYGFYEGRGTPYRLEPRAVLEVLDFLKGKQRQG